MVSKASDDLPDPETPVTTVSALCGTSKSMFLRLCTRAPRTTMLSLSCAPGFSNAFSETAILNLNRPILRSPIHHGPQGGALCAAWVGSRDPPDSPQGE